MKTLRLAAAFAALSLAAGASLAAPPAAFPDGFNNLPETHFMRDRDKIPVPYPPTWTEWFDDFMEYESGNWVTTETDVGAGDTTQALADADDGIMVYTTAGNEDDASHQQTIAELFKFESGKELYFETRLKIGDATQSDFVIGLQVRDTTSLAVSDGMFFQKDDGDALLDFHSMATSVDTASTGIHTVVDDTYVKLAFYYDGGTQVLVSVNDALVATVTATPSTTELTVSSAVQAGSAAADVLSVDYIWVAKER